MCTHFLKILKKSLWKPCVYPTQYISEPTHFRADQTPTLIDLIISNDEKFVFDICQSPPFGLSHHNVISFKLSINQNIVQLPPKVVFLMNKGDYPALKTHLKNVPWDDLLKNPTDVDGIWDNIENELNIAKCKYFSPTDQPYKQDVTSWVANCVEYNIMTGRRLESEKDSCISQVYSRY